MQHFSNKAPACVCSIPMWPPSDPWSVSSITCRDSLDQRGMATVKRTVQGAETAGISQWKAQGMATIWALLMTEGLFTPLLSSWAALALFLRQLNNGKGERQEMGNTRAGTELQWWQGSYEQLYDQDWKAGWGTPTVDYEYKKQNHAHIHPRTTGGGSPGAIQSTPLESHHHCCWMHPAIPKH